jgi:tetratricopeptide (TPR) repeat protein
MKRQQLAFRTFEHTWDRSERWAFVALPPGRLPVTATETEAIRALLAFERSAPAAAAATAYRAGLARWPANLVLAMGLGNTLYAAGDHAGAEAAFRAAGDRHDAAAAWNNLARVLLERGRIDEARAAAGRALRRAGPLEDAVRATLDEIRAREGRRP